MRKPYYFLQVVMLFIVAISAAFYASFTAEDAYITYRYAENWVQTGSLVYNLGERINAMTSPLHAVLSAALFAITGNTVTANKLIAVLLLFGSVLLVWRRYRDRVHLQVLSVVLVVPVPVLLWTFGGLETPFLLFLVSITVALVLGRDTFDLKQLCVIFLAAGLAFLTRYDSILFLLPLVVYAAARSQSLKHVLFAGALAAILPLAWLFVSFYYYGDLLPTSFYVKTPKGDLGDLIFNGIYIACYLVYVGIIPVLAVILSLLIPKRRVREVLYDHIRRVWWLYLGLLLELLYGLTMATHHMMFSFRFFVPYIPASTILVVDLLGKALEARQINLSIGRPAYFFSAFLVCLVSFQMFQYVYTYTRSVNGLSVVGEYRTLGIRDYVSFMKILQQEALDIEHHWQSVHPDEDRRPRIITYAAGMLPYTYRNSYIYEKLVSYRHCFERHQQALYADYIHILAPRQGEIVEQLPRPADSYVLVSSYDMFFDGSMEKFLVYYNPTPEAHNLTPGISDFCLANQD